PPTHSPLSLHVALPIYAHHLLERWRDSGGGPRPAPGAAVQHGVARLRRASTDAVRPPASLTRKPARTAHFVVEGPSMKHLCGVSAVVLAGWGLLANGCNMTQLAVETQAEVMEQAFPAIEEQTDYEFAREGIPANLVQIDGLLKVQPDNERLLMLATQGFCSYAYGFVEDDMQRAEFAGDLEASDRYRARAREMYLKARDYGLSLLRLRQSDFPEELPRDPDQLKKVLNELFTDAEDAPALFWTGNAWGSAINISRDDPLLVADLPFTTVFVERSVELDEKYYHAAGHVFLGVANSALGESMGGDPEKGRQHLEKALSLTGRKATLVQVNYAQAYAVQKNDKALFS